MVRWLPIPEGRARDEHCFDKSQFSIDWQAQQVTCPQGKTSRYWIPTYDRHGKDVIHIKFNPADCKVCPSRALCTQAKAGARMLAIHPDQAQHEALQKARLRQKAPGFKQKYAKRAGIEGTISQGACEGLIYVTHAIGVCPKHGFSTCSWQPHSISFASAPGSWNNLLHRLDALALKSS